MLRTLVRSVQRRWRIALAVAMAGAAIGWAFVPALPLTFMAEGRLVLRDGTWSAARAAEFARSTAVLDQAARESGQDPARLQTSLTASPRPDAPAVVLSVTAGMPSDARTAVNAVGAAFEALSAARRRDENAAALKRVEEAIQERQRDLERILSPLQSRDFARERLESLDRAIETDRAEVATLAARIEQLASRIERNEPGPARAIDTSESDRLGAEIETALRQREALRAAYPDDWPPLLRTGARIEELRSRRAIAVNREILEARFAPLRSLIEEVRDLAARRDRLQESLPARYDEAERLRQRLRPANRPADEAELLRTRAHQQSQADLIAQLEARRSRLLLERTAGEAVVDRFEPARRASLAGAALAYILSGALVLGLLAALVAESMTTTLRTEYDVRRYLNLPLMAVIPRVPPPARPAPTGGGPVAEAYGTLAALMETRARENAARLFAVTSAVPGEGKSTAACNLAVSLARAGSRVLLVDADLRRGTQHRFFSLPNEAGLSSYLQGASDTVDFIIAPLEIENLTLLPAGPPMESPVPYLHSERFQALVQDFKGGYDYVVLDLPPVRNAADPLVVAPMADGVLLVIAASETRKDDASYLKRMIRSVNGKIWGCVLMKAAIASRGYYVYAPESMNS